MQVTLFNRITQSKNGQYISITDILEKIKNGEWQDVSLKIMAESNKDKRSELKKNVPYFTPSGRFEQRKASSLLAHSGLIGIDIDEVENINSAIEILKVDEFTFSVFKSISGRGLCVLVKIEQDKHKDAFESLSKYYFEILRHPVDPACKDVSRARFVSYDPDLYVNYNSKVFKKYLPKKETKQVRPLNFIHTKSKFEKVIEKINTDITGSYQQWRDIGFALASEFGEDGRGYYHHISSYSNQYDTKTCDKQYNYCLRQHSGTNSIKIGTFYYYAKIAGIDTSNADEEVAAKIAYFAKTGGRNKDSAKKIIEMQGIEANEELINAVFESKDFNPTQNESGKSELNIDEVEMWLSANYNLKKNEVTENYENDGVELTEEDINSIYIQAKKTFEKLSREIFNYIVFSNNTERYNPIKNSLQNYRWDNKNHIQQLAKCINSDTGSFEFRHNLLKKWLVGIVESVYTSNCNQLMLVLAGKKNTGKSWFFENLLPRDLSRYFVNGMITNDKDTLISLCSNLIYFNDEFTNKEADSNTLKQILSAKQYDIRAPYGKKSVKRKKIASLCAATNETQVLNDPTGNRRIIVFEIVGLFNFELYNSIDKGQLFAQALALFDAGTRSQLTHTEIDDLESITSGKYSETSIEAELLYEFVEPDTKTGDFKTTTAIKDWLESHSKQKLSAKKLGMELKRLGYNRIGKSGAYGYMVYFKSNVPKPEGFTPPW